MIEIHLSLCSETATIPDYCPFCPPVPFLDFMCGEMVFEELSVDWIAMGLCVFSQAMYVVRDSFNM